jgi:hypothetical protein
MNRSSIAATLVALAVTGCACLPAPPVSTVPDTSRPQVSVIDGRYLVVSPEPLLFRNRQGPVRIFFQLPAGSKFRFDRERGVTIDGEILPSKGRDDKASGQEATFNIVVQRRQDQIVECKLVSDHEFSCLNRNSRPGRFLYTIRVLDEAGKSLPPLDPIIMNDL